jgi:hypothetical protein
MNVGGHDIYNSGTCKKLKTYVCFIQSDTSRTIKECPLGITYWDDKHDLNS